VIISTTLIPEGFDAFSCWPFIFVRPESRNDEALIRHELVHYDDQAWITPFWLLRYWLSKSFRWGQEVKAYRVQIEVGGISAEDAAWLLCTYKTSHTVEQARRALS